MFGIEKVQINKSSWHYRWLNKLHLAGNHYKEVQNYRLNPVTGENEWVTGVWEDRAPKSICPYFWLLMFTFAATATFAALASVLLVIITFTLTAAAALVYVWFLWIQHNPRGTLSVILVVLIPLAIVLTGNVLAGYLGRAFGRMADKPKRTPATGLFYVTRQFLKAKKSKVCPLVEFVD